MGVLQSFCHTMEGKNRMKVTEASLLKLMTSTDQQSVIPIYQRKCSWKKEQCARLWPDVDASASGS